MENVVKFNQMVNEFGQHFGYDRQMNGATTAEEVYEILKDLKWLVGKIESLIEVAEDINCDVTPRTGKKNEVYTIGQYVEMGYSAEEAPIVREHDILWNRYIEGEITIQEADRLREIWEMEIM